MKGKGTIESPSLAFSNKKTMSIVRHGSQDSVSFQKFKLVMEEGPEVGREFLVDRDRIRVGSAPDNDLCIEQDTVSRYHFEIRATEAGHRIRDLESTNGVQLDGCFVMDALLHPGARLNLGDVTLIFQPLRERVEVPLSQHDAFGGMLGTSVQMRALFHTVERVVAHDTTLLITGETGTGKGLLAKEIHLASGRSKKPFIVVDCSTIPPHLMESELFGHVRGAFTGALFTRPGSMQEAQGGTIFFDEIGELLPPMQVKLLRAIETREVKPVGSPDEVKVDVRILAATNKKLRAEVEARHFREDLYFRLNVVELRVPPLRERKEDIPYLARAFLSQLADEADRRFGEGAIRLLMRHDWPGNVRELRNVIERLVRLVDDRVIDSDSLLAASASQPGSPSAGSISRANGALPIGEAKEIFEKEYLIDLLRRHEYNVSASARTADIHRQSLHRLLRKHGIQASLHPQSLAVQPETGDVFS